MTNIVNFPRQKKSAIRGVPKEATPSPSLVKPSIGAIVVKVIWVVVVLTWPILEKVIALDCVYYFIRMVYHWDTPGMHAGLTFAAHFLALSMLLLFVAKYQPKNF